MRCMIALISAVLPLFSSAQAALPLQLSPQAGTSVSSGTTISEVLVAGDAGPVYRYDNPSGWPTVVMPSQPQPAPQPGMSRQYHPRGWLSQPQPPGTQRYEYPGNEVRCDNAVQGCYRWSGRQGVYVWDADKTREFYGPWAAKRGYPRRQQ